MDTSIMLSNLWIFYVLAYAIAYPAQMVANRVRGEPFDDPEFLIHGKYGIRLVIIAMVWLFGGLALSLFVPVSFGVLFYIGLVPYIAGLTVGGLALYSFATKSGLVTSGIHRYSRNPVYVGWSLVYFGMTLMGWSSSVWSIIFLVYFLLTLLYFHWTVLLEEAFLVGKYGDTYRAYLEGTARYFGLPKSSEEG